jgi:prephenate dehydratase
MTGIIGIQGGRGSFNEAAARKYMDGNPNLNIEYLYTSENVIKALADGGIELGICAVYNSLGGFVAETLHALQGRGGIRIEASIKLPIRHFLMKKKNINIGDAVRIYAHPQVFLQCKNTLDKKFPFLSRTVLDGNLVDTAAAAKALADGELPQDSAILGNEALADIYGFDVAAADLQDSDDNVSTFLVLKGYDSNL